MDEWLKEPPKDRPVDFGDFRRLNPISRQFGYDRGTPIDRLYIEEFLDSCQADIRGRVLEAGDNSYTLRFGGSRVTGSDVLHIQEGAPGATIIGDLANAAHIPSNSFDCVLLTQVLMLIFDLRSAVATIHRILRPGGVALLTVSGISNIAHDQWGGGWMWSFTVNSMRRLLEEEFRRDQLRVEARGNVFTAVSFLQGLSLEDIAGYAHREDDPHYQVTVLARARKDDA